MFARTDQPNSRPSAEPSLSLFLVNSLFHGHRLNLLVSTLPLARALHHLLQCCPREGFGMGCEFNLLSLPAVELSLTSFLSSRRAPSFEGISLVPLPQITPSPSSFHSPTPRPRHRPSHPSSTNVVPPRSSNIDDRWAELPRSQGMEIRLLLHRLVQRCWGGSWWLDVIFTPLACFVFSEEEGELTRRSRFLLESKQQMVESSEELAKKSTRSRPRRRNSRKPLRHDCSDDG